MAAIVTGRTTVGRPVSSDRRDLFVALATVWLAGGLFLDGWAHSHVPQLETFFTPWHGVLYSGYAALAIALVPGRLWRGRPEEPVAGWMPAGYGLGLLGAILFAVGGVCDMTWHIAFGIEASLEALLSPPHLVLLTAGMLMITTPIRAAAAKQRFDDEAGRRTDVMAGSWPVLISATSATAVAAFFLSYLSPFTDAPASLSGYENAQSFGLAQYVAFTVLMVTAVLFVRSRLGRVPVGLVTLVVAAAAVPDGVFDDFENLPAQLWPLVGAVVADLVVQWVAVRQARLVPVAAGAVVPSLVWATHLLGIEFSLGVAWSLELWSGVVVLTTLAGAVLGGLFLPATRTGG
ncbi:hypothetical protein [Dactylosporangium sp. CA-233914]|uniref:hypothetical protein n=1 Tax=Dactylosporangium sp. CA-233914 TaxID=3239934 RepID=UPI003D8FB7A8